MAYKCILEKEIDLYINYLRLNGQKYEKSTHVLKSFAEFGEYHLFKKQVDDEFLNNWIKEIKKTHHGKLPQQYVYAYNAFSEYLNCLGIPAVKLDTPGYSQVRKDRFFSEEEIIYLFKAIDHSVNRNRMNFYDVSFPLFVRCIYGLGLRPAECLEVTGEDFDAKNREITIYRKTDGKPRVLPVRDILNEYLSLYVKHFSIGELVFVKNNKNVTMHNYEERWKKVVSLLGTDDEKSDPSLFSLRHSFAINSLKRAINENKDINQYAWTLSVFMGFTDSDSIQNYMKYCNTTITSKINMIMEDYDSEIFDEGVDT